MILDVHATTVDNPSWRGEVGPRRFHLRHRLCCPKPRSIELWGSCHFGPVKSPASSIRSRSIFSSNIVMSCLAMCNNECFSHCFGSLYNIVTRTSSRYQPPTQPRPAYMPLKDKEEQMPQTSHQNTQDRVARPPRKRDKRMNRERHPVHLPTICAAALPCVKSK